MSFNKEDLKVLKYVQGQHSVALSQVARHFHKELSSVRKQLKQLNDNLPKTIRLKIVNGTVTTTLSYAEYLSFIHNLDSRDYVSTATERIAVILLTCYEQGYVNLSELYGSWNLSLTTKKKDTQLLRNYLQKYKLQVVVLRKKGITVKRVDNSKRSELSLRLLNAQLLLPIVEVDRDFIFYERLANTPFEHLLYLKLEKIIKSVGTMYTVLYKRILAQIGVTPSYPSKKMLLLYLALYCYHQNQLHYLPRYFSDTSSPQRRFLEDSLENSAVNQLLSMLDFRPALTVLPSKRLSKKINDYFALLCRELNLNFYTKEQTLQELYTYLHKKILINYYNIELTDKLVKNTKAYEPQIYEKVELYRDYFLQDYQFAMSEDHISAITLILKKWIYRNRIITDNKVRLIIVTNTIEEKLEYFMESLKEYIDFATVAVLDINELYQIEQMKFNYIITLSDRTTLTLKNLGYDCIRLHFFLTDDDIAVLRSLNIPEKATKFIAHDFAKQIVNCSSESEIESYLKNKFSDNFI